MKGAAARGRNDETAHNADPGVYLCLLWGARAVALQTLRSSDKMDRRWSAPCTTPLAQKVRLMDASVEPIQPEGHSGDSPDGVLGRQPERAAIRLLLDSAQRGKGSGLLIIGDAGIGKSRMLNYAAESAQGVRVARVSGVESEVQLGYAGLHRLMVPFLHRVDQLPPPQQMALHAAFGDVPGPPVPFLVGLATVRLLADLAVTAPQLVLIDDAHWIDSESLAALGFLSRRLGRQGPGIIIAARETAVVIAAFQGLPLVELSGLRNEEARALLDSHVARHLDDRTAAQLVSEAGGNPLALIELAHTLTDAQLSGQAPLPKHLPLGHHLDEHFGRRLADLPADTQRLLSLMSIALADSPASPIEFWWAAAFLGLDAAAIDHAAAVGLVDVEPELSFRHPLIRSAIYAHSTLGVRRTSHAALAAIIDPTIEPDRRTWHLAAAAVDADESIAAALATSADRAGARGAYSRQAELLERAAELSPSYAERISRRLTAAQCWLTGGKTVAAQMLLDQVPVGLSDPILLARASAVRAQIDLRAGQSIHVAAALLKAARMLQAAQLVDQPEDALIRNLLYEALSATLASGAATVDTTPRDVAQAVLSVRPAERPTARDRFLYAFATRLAEDFRGAASLFNEALRSLETEPLTETSSPLGVLTILSAFDIWADKSAQVVTERILAFDRENGLPIAIRYSQYGLAILDILAGRFLEADIRIVETDHYASEPVSIVEHEWATIVLAAWRGQEQEVRTAAELITTAATTAARPALIDNVLNALLIVELGLGRYQQAFLHARQLFEIDALSSNGRYLTDIVEASVRAGEIRLATLALGRLEDRAPAAGTHWALGALARGRALLDETGSTEVSYRSAITHLSQTTIRTELAHTHLNFGEWLRRHHRITDARGELRLAHDQFSAMGAATYAERAAAELRATGGRVRQGSNPLGNRLTPQESRIMALASTGLSNAEIANRLFLSDSTVQYHLSKVFRKLSITSRRQLMGHNVVKEALERSDPPK